jgi:hypothetical protein
MLRAALAVKLAALNVIPLSQTFQLRLAAGLFRGQSTKTCQKSMVAA